MAISLWTLLSTQNPLTLFLQHLLVLVLSPAMIIIIWRQDRKLRQKDKEIASLKAELKARGREEG
jgi:preprotein translocase subunit YajC